ncbi:MAG: peptide chain release factor N(5)-glutamine methyltransferase [Solirubrobacterales bacterium]
MIGAIGAFLSHSERKAPSAGSVGEALGAATDALRAAGVDTPRLDAELLLAEATGLDRGRLLAEPELGVGAPAARAFGAMVRRRVAREPVAYILGRKGFRRIEVAVDPRVLIPRPETELLVELALELEPRTVLDVGTGSGAVALAVADELPAATVVGTDTSAAALELARANAERLGLADRVRFAHGMRPNASADGAFELLLANLPYVTEAEWSTLFPEITEYEPRSALVSGPTGLEAIEALLGELATGAAQARAIGLEIGAGQARTVGDLVRRSGYERVEVRPDLTGIERLVVGANGA